MEMREKGLTKDEVECIFQRAQEIGSERNEDPSSIAEAAIACIIEQRKWNLGA